MVVVSGLVIALMTTLANTYAVEQHRAHLRAITSSRARMIEAIGRYEASAHGDPADGSPLERTLALVVEAHEAFPGLGETGEFTLARLDGDRIRFVLRHRHDDAETPPPVPMGSRLAEPMRQALLGHTGTLIGPDYRGETVLAAYEPVGIFDLGIVAKTDMSEVRAPVVEGTLVVVLLSSVLVLVGAAFAVRVGNPLVQRLEQDARQLAAEVEERRRAQADLLLLSAAVEQISESVMITDRDGRIQYVNPAFEAHTGFQRDEAIGHRPDEVGETEGFDFDRAATVLTGVPWRGQLVSHRKDGTRLVEDTSISPLVDPGGTPTHFVAVRKDITERLALEAQLQRAQRLETVGTLAAGIAHDFNNILHAVLGHTQAVRAAPDTAAESLDDIDAAARRAAELVRQLRTFSQDDPVEARPTSLVAVVREVHDLLVPSLPPGRRWRMHAPEGPCVVLADPSQLHQVVLNLCTNALQALATQGTHLQVLVEAVADDRVRLVVEDDGPGVPEDVRDRIFDPFFTTRRMGGGTGLGLAMVHGIVTGLGGTVALESPPEGGSRFVVELPRTRQPARTHEPVVRERRAPARPGQGRLLVVDDDPLVLRATARALSRAGYAVAAHDDPIEALEAFRVDPTAFDAVVTDLAMPGLSGDQLVRRLRQLKPDLPVVLISGRLEARTLEGLDVHTLAKPLAMDVLLDHIAALLP